MPFLLVNFIMKFDKKNKFSFIYALKGGAGGRVINIASMAGLVPGVTGFEGLGYPVSKWGTVAFTRYTKDHT